ncbi:MAG: DUF2752 domain-containing protein [Bacteroidota bacterium]
MKQFTGFDCPGCGIQRSFVALLHGELGTSFFLFPALLPYLFTLLYSAAHLVLKFRNGARYITWLFCVTTAVMLLGYLLKFV